MTVNSPVPPDRYTDEGAAADGSPGSSATAPPNPATVAPNRSIARTVTVTGRPAVTSAGSPSRASPATGE